MFAVLKKVTLNDIFYNYRRSFVYVTIAHFCVNHNFDVHLPNVKKNADMGNSQKASSIRLYFQNPVGTFRLDFDTST